MIQPDQSAPKVSVIVPMFNASSTVRASIESLQHQALGSWEAVVVDDGSTDDGAVLVGAMSEADPRIRLIRQTNSGVSSARNRATREARGEYLYWLDPDDRCGQDALGLLVQAAERSGTGAAVGHHDVVSAEGGLLHEYRIPHPQIGLADLIEGCSTRCGSHVVRRATLSGWADPVEWDAELMVWEDRDYWIRLAERGVRWAVIDRVVTEYVVQPGSLSKRALEMMICGDRVLRAVFDRHRGEPGFENARMRALLSKNALSSACRAAVISGDGAAASRALHRTVGDAVWTPEDLVDAGRFAVIYGCGLVPGSSNISCGWASGLDSFWEAIGMESGPGSSLWTAFARAVITPRQIAKGLLDRCSDSAGVVVVGHGTNGRAVVREAARRGIPFQIRDDAAVLPGLETEPMHAPIPPGWTILVTPLADEMLRPRFEAVGAVFASEVSRRNATEQAWDLSAILGESTPC